MVLSKNIFCFELKIIFSFSFKNITFSRSNLESYCLLISDKESKRLDILTKTNDGYKISEADFKLRGSGDLLGIRQSGDMSFKLVNLERDYNILLKAKEEVEYSLNNKLIDIIDLDNLA